ncbi:hypothetical protein Drose_15110 [Dactylosporangium roseum]|uniref:Uncharacterized protein n=1 Tax=Dactylosporangium roseum TaxID=47989 RepID=A0ABY5ZBF9_9ACTN|nr:hypothetical protein [Dactylosporangium roseum]UWZ39445.1 hypothetical protein Drose_15110 [Dactylosporangium roseum]
MLVRWRLFAALDVLAKGDQATINLTPAQHALVHAAADRHRAGLQARDCSSLRALLADAVVRRDGTASLTVRRYITSRYEELLTADQRTHPDAHDLLRRVANPNGGGPSLGVLLGRIEKGRSTDFFIRAAVGLPSYKWLFGDVATALRNIGNGSHNLRPPSQDDAAVVGAYLDRFHTDGTGRRDAGLPEPPTTPAHTVVTVWFAGNRTDQHATTIGQRLLRDGLPTAILEHIDTDQPAMRAVIFGTPGHHGSLGRADDDADRLTSGGHHATAYAVDASAPADMDAVEHAITEHLTPDTAALLLIPTGPKPVLLALLGVLRRIGAQHGIPLFVRQNAEPSATTAHTDVYLWPALTDGDLALLVAAREALNNLELDVAWRLLAASAIDPAITDNAHRLAAAFASRNPNPNRHDRWPSPDPAPTSDRTGRTRRMAVQRLELVNATLAQTTNPADRIRLLVLAADTLEASIAAAPPTTRPPANGTAPRQRPGATYRKFRKDLGDVAKLRTREAHAARILLILNKARDHAPITHGAHPDPDTVVADATDALTRAWHLTPAEHAALPRDVSTLLHHAVAAATACKLGRPDQPGNLLTLHRHIDQQIATSIAHRQQSHPTIRSDTQVPPLRPTAL